MEFEWDLVKAESNLASHKVGFEEAQTVFDDPLAIVCEDTEHSFGERRFLLVGESFLDRTLVVCFTERGDNIRVISARTATRGEGNSYEES
ncbi:MAG: BrnT family toxin [Acidobacteriota bacterium]